MDEKEKLMTSIIRSLIKNGIITFVTTALGSLLLGPEGIAIGVGGSVIHMLLTSGGMSWASLQASTNWKTLVLLALQVAAKLAIENMELISRVVKDLIQSFSRLFNRDEQCQPQHYSRSIQQ